MRRKLQQDGLARHEAMDKEDARVADSLHRAAKQDLPVKFTPLRCVFGSLCLSFLLFAATFGYLFIIDPSFSRPLPSVSQPQVSIEILQPGTVNCPRTVYGGDQVAVHYTGWLQQSKKQFDSSVGKAPFTFTVGAQKVIEGWENGVVGMCAGEKRRLTIPPELGYGDRHMRKIPPGSTLVFEIELLSIK